MHELSIAISLVDLVTDATEEAGAEGGVEAVTVRVGELSGVVSEALRFAWDSATEGTRCEGARLVIERTPGRVLCPTCQTETEIEFPPVFVCGRCGRPTGDVISGRELDLMRVELNDEASATA